MLDDTLSIRKVINPEIIELISSRSAPSCNVFIIVKIEMDPMSVESSLFKQAHDIKINHSYSKVTNFRQNLLFSIFAIVHFFAYSYLYFLFSFEKGCAE